MVNIYSASAFLGVAPKTTDIQLLCLSHWAGSVEKFEQHIRKAAELTTVQEATDETKSLDAIKVS